MSIQELETRLKKAIDELQATFEKQFIEWKKNYQALEVSLKEAKKREESLQIQNAQLEYKLKTLNITPEDPALLNQFKILHTHLEELAQDTIKFTHSLNHNKPY